MCGENLYVNFHTTFIALLLGSLPHRKASEYKYFCTIFSFSNAKLSVSLLGADEERKQFDFLKHYNEWEEGKLLSFAVKKPKMMDPISTPV